MDLGLAQIVVAIITVCIPTLATTLATKSMKKQANKHSTWAGIMQLIIKVPLALEATWETISGWDTYASYIVGV